MEDRTYPIQSIWLVDDDEDDHHVFETALRNVLPEATIRHIHDCPNLLSLLEEGLAPDLLFLDLHLPSLDGATCLRHLSDTKKIDQLKVIVYSGSDTDTEIHDCYRLGAVLYIVKPITFDRLTAILQSLMRLNWNEPASITHGQKRGDRFLPFAAE